MIKERAMDTYFLVFETILKYTMPIVLILLAGAIWWHSDLSKKEIQIKYEQGRAYLIEVRVRKVRSRVQNRSRRYYAIVDYTDKNNCMCTGKVSIPQLKFVNPGDVMTVLYDSENNTLYPASYAEKPKVQWTVVTILIIVGSIICILDQIGLF
jgi:hypothetical protein